MILPKYSVIIPTLNGAETLSITLPEMLKIERDDVEWVISNNKSDDGTKELISSISDPRVRLVEPPERLPLGKHLEFAYLQARGEWQGHLGDDDILFPSRFELLDQIISDYNPSIICGEFVRYTWPNHYDKRRCNTLNQRVFDNQILEESGISVAKRLLNTISIYGGGSWVVHKSIVNTVRNRCGYFVSPDHVEFFAMRAACALSPKVVKIGLPIYVMGRHNKSSSDQGFCKKGTNPYDSWDLKFELPTPWTNCPFQWKGYTPISLDAALSVQNIFPDLLGEEKINWLFWLPPLYGNLNEMIGNGQLDQKDRILFSEGLKKIPLDIQIKWRLRQYHIDIIIKLLKKGMHLYNLKNHPIKSKKRITERFGLPDELVGERVGIQNIVDVPKWVEKTYFGYFPIKD